MNYKAMGAAVKARRKQLKLTQEELAEKVDISASFLGHIERGTRTASLETVVKLCNCLKVSPSLLLSADIPEKNYIPVNETDNEKLIILLQMALDTVQNTKP